MKKRRPRIARFRIFRGSGVTILIYFFLGAILNVAVAWGLAVVPRTPYSPGLDEDVAWCFRENTRQIWIVLRYESFGITLIESTYDPDTYPYNPKTSMQPVDLVPTFMEIEKTIQSAPDQLHHHSIYMSGWPFRSVYCECAPANPSQPLGSTAGGFRVSVRNRALIGRYAVYPVPIPLLPIWPGFIFNTLFYTVILWLPYQGLFHLRRRRRIRQGRCGQCGYMVAPNLGVPGASPNCTECGTPIHPRNTKPRNTKPRNTNSGMVGQGG